MDHVINNVIFSFTLLIKITNYVDRIINHTIYIMNLRIISIQIWLE